MGTRQAHLFPCCLGLLLSHMAAVTSCDRGPQSLNVYRLVSGGRLPVHAVDGHPESQTLLGRPPAVGTVPLCSWTPFSATSAKLGLRTRLWDGPAKETEFIVSLGRSPRAHRANSVHTFAPGTLWGQFTAGCSSHFQSRARCTWLGWEHAPCSEPRPLGKPTEPAL